MFTQRIASILKDISEGRVSREEGLRQCHAIRAEARAARNPAPVEKRERVPVAVIGMAGRYPQAADLSQFWDNLTHGVDCVTEVPPGRWDTGRGTYRSGGFLEDVDRFDAAFFNIAPREAERMDPQERLFLETAWSALEDGGYTRRSLQDDEQPGNVGVFVGVTYQEYQLFGAEQQARGQQMALAGIAAGVANRVSYFCNFHGPSISIDTMCSSSLTALHLACQSLQAGECAMALAGGVNLSIHPNKYLVLSQGQFVSSRGRCESFGADGDGYVPAEGVGCLLLKPLDAAVRDGDQILGVIRGTSVNHGGKTNGYTVPNPHAQAAVIRRAMTTAGISPGEISYLEAHGTGTSLGDPIEIAGLSQAYGDGAGHPCAIGSVKSNIGHCEAAAGVAGVTKVLLQLQHRTLVPSLHAERLNPNIDFAATPFVVQQSLADWVPASGRRVAGISSFGAGGSNAHVLIAETEESEGQRQAPSDGPAIVVLSAQNQDRLRQAAMRLRDHIDHADHDLADIAYTLQVGRETMECRLAFVARSTDEARARLEAWLKHPSMAEGVCVGVGNREVPTRGGTRGRPDLSAQIVAALAERAAADVARLWAQGGAVDWQQWYTGPHPRRVSLPTYPFDRSQRYWFDSYQKPMTRPSVPTVALPVELSLVSARLIEDSIAFVMMHDRAQRNQMAGIFVEELERIFTAISTDPRIKVVVLAGYDEVFCLGGTKEALVGISEGRLKYSDVPFVYRGLLDCPVPVIAAMEGHAVGGGLAFGCQADIIYLAAESVYGANFMQYGFTPGMGGTLFFREKFGANLAQEMMFSADSLTGQTIKDKGAPLTVTTRAQVLPEAMARARSLASKPRHALTVLKKTMAQRLLDQLPGVVAEELAMHDETITRADVRQTIEQRIDRLESLGEAADARQDPPALFPSPVVSPFSLAPTDVSGIEARIRTIVAHLLHMDESHVRAESTFQDMGVDSIAAVELARDVNAEFGLSLDAVVLYDCPTVEKYARHVAEQVGQLNASVASARSTGQAAPVVAAPVVAAPVVAAPVVAAPVAPTRAKVVLSATPAAPVVTSAPTRAPIALEPTVAPVASPTHASSVPQGIAVIGMAGRFPGAANLDEFWRNLSQGVNSVSEVPASRWSIDAVYDPRPMQPNKTYSRWGGFLDGVDEFDPLFFSLSPAEAAQMDPQQRLFLQTAWHAIEDAGYAPDVLAGTPCGVFVGVGQGDYLNVLNAAQETPGAQALLGNTCSMLSGRIAYFLDLKGPNMAIDTACSSSLVALHQACRSIWAGECETALAGGVYVMTTPMMHVMTSRGAMLSPTGQCRAFDQDADGFVLAEGVGVLLLKRLDQAERDGDHIYGVIRGSAVNYDGATNGITAPSAASQEQLEAGVYREFGIPVSAIGLVEAHGTGTKLGDPIEVKALTRAFRQSTAAEGYCAIGSVKSNIGHALAAAGVAGAIKALLCLSHRKLVPTLHYDQLNEHIALAGGPFTVNTEYRDWNPAPGSQTRFAALSSFGLSGTNAHMVFEEYQAAPALNHLAPAVDEHLMVVSARTPDGLRRRMSDLAAWAEAHGDGSMADVAFTLSCGRRHFDYRCAVAARSMADLATALRAAVEGRVPASVMVGRGERPDTADLAIYREVLRTTIERRRALLPGSADAAATLLALAGLYVKGFDVPWAELSAGVTRRRVSLPLYPFERERCWPNVPVAATAAHAAIHTHLGDDDPCVADHQVLGRSVLPAVAMLELVRAAAESAGHGPVSALREVTWVRPVIVDGAATVAVDVSVTPDGIRFALLCDGERCAAGTVVARGHDNPTPAALDLDAIGARCDRETDVSECYAMLAGAGIAYGPSFRTLTRLRYSSTEVLADLRRADSRTSVLDRGLLPPGVLDGALQAGLGLVLGGGAASPRAAVPFALQELALHGSVPDVAHAHVTQSATGAFQITLTDATGRVCLEFKELVTRPAAGVTGQVLTLVPRWTADRLPPVDGARAARMLVMTSTVRAHAASIDADERLTLSDRPQDPTTWCVELFTALKARLHERLSGPHEYVVLVSEDDDAAQVASLTGLLRTAALENPLVQARVLRCPAGASTADLQAWLSSESAHSAPGVTEVRWNPVLEQREVRQLQEVVLPPAGTSPFRPDGVYWITGGAGGLGLLTARYLARMSGVTIVLSSRGDASVEVTEALTILAGAGARVCYLPCDVASLESVASVRETIVSRFGTLTGVIHSAGVIRDAFILKKDAGQVHDVMAPKVAGLLNLMRATESDPLDVLIVYSAAAGTLGNLGQCDYAAANAFMDAVAEAHPGRLVSIGWPLWADGGMQVDAETRRLMRSAAGIVPMPTDVAFETLEAICAARVPRVLVLHGHAATMRRTLIAPQVTTPDARVARPAAHGDVAEAAVIAHLQAQLARPLKLSPERIEVTRSFEEYGIDSVMVLEVTAELERDWGPLPRTLFFEYPHVTALARHLMMTYPDKASALLSTSGAPPVAPVAPPAAPAPAPAPEIALLRNRDIAIIGLAGRYPQADTLEQFWRNLQAGRDSVTEIPLDRWDHTPYYDALKNGGGKVRSKWGGFLSRVDEFDPYFFNISPLEAEIMDPQERVMLETAWEAMEDAGYRRDLEQRRAIGVYVGVMYSEYQLYGAAEQAQGRPIALSGSPASIANRVSYVLNLHGPSLAVDSMCSSSLTAVHLACQALAAGHIEMALAGGVNLSLHPNKYLLLGQGQFVSSKGRCESFGVGGDGYVPGEGVGCVVLKPLDRALADRDHIYGVIKATTLNHGGKTNGYTVPNPAAQAEVIRAAIREAGVAPGDISYVEAHGTGTSLGDPVEIEGLRQAFGGEAGDRRCAIGSVKSNIGHCESAAGMAGLTKILLQMSHGQLVPSLHSQELNPHINFARTAFVVQQQLAPWTGEPRVAGLSSFGAGGSNAHLIIQDWPAPVVQPDTDAPVIITLSARTDEQLRQVVTRFRDWIADPERSASADLLSIAFTLQQGREAMARRLACVASTRSAVRESCEAWLDGRPLPTGAPEALQAIADGWMAGLPQDWTALYRDARPSRVSVPTYPFARERFWFPRVAEVSTPAVVTRDRSISVDEPWLSDHRVHGQAVVPGVAYLQMVIDAATPLRSVGRVVLTDVMWVQPLVVADTATLRVTLTPREEGYDFEVTSPAAAGTQAHCRGSLAWAGDPRHSSPVNVERVQAALMPVETRGAGQSWYDAFAAVGLSYGPAYRTIQRLWGDETRSLAFVEADEASPQLDAALQAVAGVRRDAVEATPLPFAIAVFEPPTHLPRSFFVSVVKTGDDRYDCDWIQQDGTVLGRVRGLTMRTSADALSGLTYSIGWRDASIAEDLPQVPTATGRALVIAGRDARGLEHAIRGRHGDHVDVLSEVGDASAVRTLLRDSAPIETVYHLAGLDDRADDPCAADRIDQGYGRSTLGLFRCVKALLEAGYDDRDLRLIAVICQTQRTAASDVIEPGAAGVVGLCQSLARECPRWTVTVVDVDRGLLAGPSAAHDDLLARLIREPKDVDAGVIVYRGSQRLVRDVQPVALRERVSSRVREGGLVVIAGGAGGLGVTVTEALITRHQAQVVWLGRRPLDADIRAQINRLGELGPRPRYVQADIADRAQMEDVRELLTHGGQRIHGVVHAALALNDRSLRRMDEARFNDTVRGKIRGTVVLTETLGRAAEDWVCFFSSVQSLFGAPGQANYAAGSTFEDAYATAVRPSLRAAVHVINWGYWGDVGVAADAQSRARMAQQGVGSISRREGVDAFFRALDNAVDQLVVFKRAPIPESVVVSAAPSVVTSHRGTSPIVSIIAEALKIPASRITPTSRLEALGVDSILSVVLTDKLEAVFGRLPRTLVFEYQTVDQLSAYFAEHHAERWQALQPPAATPPAVPAETSAPQPMRVKRSDIPADAIAIIGISGRYPGAPNLRTLWRNLRAGVDAITEIPQGRWDAAQYYDPSPTPAAGRVRSKWGGFIADADKFDPLFFNIAPAEADLLDPQERLFLQTVWETMESAGYTRQRLSALQTSSGLGVGVFVGAMYQLYPWVAPSPVTSTVSYWSIANRVSYFFDFQGPSIAVDTACSSSTVALHMACESLRRGEVVCAFAGGVNLSLHPNKYLALQGAGMLGSEPVSRCLGHGDGFVPGEGVGAVLLKPLAQAQEDGDIIHAVITATRVHHAGRGNGYRTPNPTTHAHSIACLLNEAGTTPDAIDYVEVAANGISLAESIELAALARVFQSTDVAPPVPIGSVKSNLGHLEAASGMSQLAKVVLQLQHGELVPSLHADPDDAALNIRQSPFAVQQAVGAWPRVDGRPRRALINSVGAGGTNAHVVIEEYVPVTPVPTTAGTGPVLIVLSARTPEVLTDVVGRLRHHLEDEAIRRAVNLHDLAYTLQVGREALGVRLALVSASIEDLIEQLSAVQAGTPVDGVMVRGQVGGADYGVHALVDGDAGRAFVSTLTRDGDLERLARLWVAGADLPWSALHADGRRCIDLPTYPFERRRCWAQAPPVDRVEHGDGVGGGEVADDGLATALRRIVADVVKVDPAEIDDDRPLTEYGVESMLSTLIMETVRRRYGNAVSLAAILEHPTLRTLTTYVAAVSGAPSSVTQATPPELVPIQPSGTRPPSFFVHGLVGFAHLYKKLAATLGPDYPVYGLQARGVDSQQAPFADIAAMAAHYVECIQTVQPEGPYFLGGYSSGGVIALEMARQLAARGESVGRVFLLDTYAPTAQTTEAMEQSIDYALRSVMTANLFLTGTEHPASWITVDELDGIVPDQHVVHLLKRIEARGTVRLAPDQIYRMLRGSIDVSNSTGEALKRYDPLPYEASPVVWFKATRQFIDEGNALALPPRVLNVGDRDAAWHACVPAGLETIELDCDHFGLLDEPMVTRVADALATYISNDVVTQAEPQRTMFTVHQGRVSRALVVGGGIAGLVAARVLADHFDQVTILERDRLHDGAAWRKGIPQGNHLHNLLKGGLNVLCDLFPGFDADLVGLGSVPFRVGFDLRQEDEMGLWPQRDFGITHYCQSRPLLEWCLRRRLQQVANVQIEDDIEPQELFWSKNGARVLGVRVADRDGAVEDYRADLIVNATGRSERMLRQLQERGWAAPEETRIPVDLGYSTCIFEIPDDPARPWKGVYAYSSGAGEGAARQGGSILPIEDNQWIVTLGGRSGSYPPTDIEGFLRFARQLDTPTVYEAIRHARPVSGVVEHFRYPASRLRHFDRLTTMPERLIHIGDVVGSFDPVFGQGMSSAALQAKALGILLSAGGGRPAALHGIERAFARAAATIVQTPWQLAAKSHLERNSESPHVDADADRFLALSKRAFDDPEVHRVIIEVFHLIKVYEQLEADGASPADRLRSGPPIRL